MLNSFIWDKGVHFIQRQIGDIDMKTDNIILNTDSYKTSHFGFMEPNTTKQYSYIEARKGGLYDYSVFFGLQYFIKKYLSGRVTRGMIDEAEDFLTKHGLPFNREGWEYIVDNIGGKLPIRIKAVPEGTLVPEGNVLVTVENTDEQCAWVTSYIETALLRGVWYGTTVATRSHMFRKLILKYLEKTGDPDSIDFKFVDFGSRGASSKESSEIAGAAHLINFMATDNIVGILTTMDYYNSSEPTGFSIPASEHTVTIGWGGEEREIEFFSNAIDVYGGEGKMFANVSDSYDFSKALDKWALLRDKLEGSGSTVVIRPDSGDPTEMVMLALNKLEKSFGVEWNDKGYKVLNPAVRIIQGDGVNYEKVEEILSTMEKAKFSADNVSFGCGGFLLQDVNRDTLRFAMKGSYIEVNGEKRDVNKVTLTDPTKASKAGRVTLIKRNNEIITVREEDMIDGDEEMLSLAYNDGVIYTDKTFQSVRDLSRG